VFGKSEGRRNEIKDKELWVVWGPPSSEVGGQTAAVQIPWS